MPGSTHSPRYFPAIDGLRAIAVLAVILFHLRPERLPGGFAGVDLFFVISGFVVTSSLAGRRFTGLRELLAYFYARRIVRILPALLAMLLVTALFATLVMRLAAFHSSTVTALAAFFGVSNIALALQETNYFAPSADFDPFLHTWTLGVEEQFYLVFPFFFYLFRGAFTDPAENRRALRAAVAICVLSFAVCGVLAAVNARYAFYLMPSRLWELGAGVALRLAMPRWQPAVSRLRSGTAAMAGAAFAAGLLATFLFVPISRFPFPAAIVPVGSALGLIALVCARPAAPLARGLAHPAATFVGRLSYSLYLWHWPVFALFRWTVGLDGNTHAAAALVISAAAAVASYYLVEEPLRRSPRVRTFRRRTIMALGAGAAMVSAVAAHQLFTAQQSLATHTAQSSYWYGSHGEAQCRLATTTGAFHGGTLNRWVPECPGDGSRAALWVVGDSHALAYTRMVMRYAAETGTPVTHISRPNCALPSLWRPAPVRRGCREFQRAAQAELSRAVKRGDVIFLPGLRISRIVDSWSGRPIRERFTPREKDAMYREAHATLTALSSTGALVVIEAPLPVFPSPAFRCSDWFNRANPICRHGLHSSRAEMEARRAPVVARMKLLAASVPNLSVWDPFPVVCPEAVCTVYRDGQPLFIDTDHLSGRGNDLLYPSFAHAIELARAGAPSHRDASP